MTNTRFACVCVCVFVQTKLHHLILLLTISCSSHIYLKGASFLLLVMDEAWFYYWFANDSCCCETINMSGQVVRKDLCQVCVCMNVSVDQPCPGAFKIASFCGLASIFVLFGYSFLHHHQHQHHLPLININKNLTWPNIYIFLQHNRFKFFDLNIIIKIVVVFSSPRTKSCVYNRRHNNNDDDHDNWSWT